MWYKVGLNPPLRPLLPLNIWGNSSFFKSWSEWTFKHPKAQIFLWNSWEQGISQKLLLFSLPLSFRVQTLAISSTIFSCLLVTSRVSLPTEQPAPAFQHQHCPEILSLTAVTHYSNVPLFHGGPADRRNVGLWIVTREQSRFGVVIREKCHFPPTCTHTNCISSPALCGSGYPLNPI